MEGLKKRFFTVLIGILLVFIFLSGCTKNENQEEILEKSTIDISSIISAESTPDLSNIISYCAKEESEENRLYFNYPQFKETTDKAEEKNKLITKFILSTLYIDDFNVMIEESARTWNWDDDDYQTRAMQVDYRVVRNDSEYFSVVFEGLFNHKHAAHPHHYFTSLNIDIEKNEIVKLSDLYNVDINFVQLFRKEFKEQIRLRFAEKIGDIPENIPESFDEILNEYSDIDLLDWLYLADTMDSGFCSFLTNKALGISVPLPFAIGNHIEIMISYDKLIKYIL